MTAQKAFKKKSKQNPTLSYTTYLLLILALLIIVVIGLKGTQLNNYCPDHRVPCQVLLKKGAINPYRKSKHAAYTGWHFAGYAEMDACWAGLPELCVPCNDSYPYRTRACRKKYPRHMTRPTR